MSDVLKEISPKSANANRVRRVFGKCIQSHLRCQGDDFAGFALVSWDHRGAAQTAFITGYGPIDRCLMPSYVKDALNRHIAASLAQEQSATIITPDDPA